MTVERSKIKCRALSGKKLVITAQGFVYPCVAMKNFIFPCGFNNIKIVKLKGILKIFKELLKPFADSTCEECPAQQMIKCLNCKSKICKNSEKEKSN